MVATQYLKFSRSFVRSTEQALINNIYLHRVSGGADQPLGDTRVREVRAVLRARGPSLTRRTPPTKGTTIADIARLYEKREEQYVKAIAVVTSGPKFTVDCQSGVLLY